MKRELRAILAADVVGYSRLMEADEEGTVNRQKQHLAETMTREQGKPIPDAY